MSESDKYKMTARGQGSLEGKVALITGTGGGQGRAAAMLFAEAGCRVVGCDLKKDGAEETVELVKAAGGEMTSFAPVDLSSEEEATGWVDDAAAVYGGIDILYNNASSAWIGPFEDMTFENWRTSIANELDIISWPRRRHGST